MKYEEMSKLIDEYDKTLRQMAKISQKLKNISQKFTKEQDQEKIAQQATEIHETIDAMLYLSECDHNGAVESLEVIKHVARHNADMLADGWRG